MKSQINITPLIDVLLVLLVIFMVITPITPKGLETRIPATAPPQPVQPKNIDTLLIRVDASGSILLNQEPMNSLSEPMFTLQDVLKTRADRTVFIQGSPELLFDNVAQVVDVATASGAARIGLLTKELRN